MNQAKVPNNCKCTPKFLLEGAGGKNKYLFKPNKDPLKVWNELLAYLITHVAGIKGNGFMDSQWSQHDWDFTTHGAGCIQTKQGGQSRV
jgi:hypothetical protein